MLVCIVGIALALIALGWFQDRRSGGARASRRSPITRLALVLDEEGAKRAPVSAAGAAAGVRATELARWEERFGIMMLGATREHQQVAQLVFTRPDCTRTVLVELDAELRAWPRLRRHGSGEPTGGMALTAGDARRLLDAVEEHAPEAFDRLYLSTSAGPLTVEDGAIGLPDVTIDLSRPLVHESYVFLEGPVLYRALAVRQAALATSTASASVIGAELPLQERVFVVPLAEPLGADHDRSRAAGIPHRAPPRRESRVAIDQLFFAPLAALLEGAPLTARASSRGNRVDPPCPAASTSPPPSTT